MDGTIFYIIGGISILTGALLLYKQISGLKKNSKIQISDKTTTSLNIGGLAIDTENDVVSTSEPADKTEIVALTEVQNMTTVINDDALKNSSI